MQQLGAHWKDFHEFDIWALFENLSLKFNFDLYLKRITGALHEDQYTLQIISTNECTIY
jgi:hypothetical protein